MAHVPLDVLLRALLLPGGLLILAYAVRHARRAEDLSIFAAATLALAAAALLAGLGLDLALDRRATDAQVWAGAILALVALALALTAPRPARALPPLPLDPAMRASDGLTFRHRPFSEAR